jgi:hypothetical protein
MADSPVFMFNDLIISDQSMGGDVTSTVVDISEAGTIAVQAVWSAGSTPIGSAILQASLDDVTYTDVSSSAVTGNSGSILFNLDEPGYRYLRLFYDRTSGSGTLNARMTAKRN